MNDLGIVEKCPLKKISLAKLATSHFYRHPILKKILNGDYWNGEIYGYNPNGKWIYIGKEKVTVFPPDNKNDESIDENKMNKLLYAGLAQIKLTLNDPAYGDCANCKFYADSFMIGEKDYNVCKYKAGNSH